MKDDILGAVLVAIAIFGGGFLGAKLATYVGQPDNITIAQKQPAPQTALHSVIVADAVSRR
jgi:hypothetical protein